MNLVIILHILCTLTSESVFTNLCVFWTHLACIADVSNVTNNIVQVSFLLSDEIGQIFNHSISDDFGNNLCLDAINLSLLSSSKAITVYDFTNFIAIQFIALVSVYVKGLCYVKIWNEKIKIIMEHCDYIALRSWIRCLFFLSITSIQIWPLDFNKSVVPIILVK